METKTAFGLESFIKPINLESKEELSQDNKELNSTKTEKGKTDTVPPDDKQDKVENKSEAKPDAKPDAKSDEKDKEKKLESESKIDWESDENTYKKRYRDTSKYATSVNQHNIELKKNLERIEKKLDGTYNEEEEKKAETVPSLTQAEIRGKIAASQAAANEMFGAEYVEKTLGEFNEQYGNNNSIQSRVLTSDAPVVEAIRVMKERTFYQKYGTDVEKIEGKIEARLIEELTPKITKEVTKQLMERMEKKVSSPEGLSETKGDGLIKDTKKTPQRKPLGAILSG